MLATATIDQAIEACRPPLIDDSGSLFDLIGGSSLVADGQALLVSIEPVKAALGERWDARRDHIYELCERHFRKHLGPSDICERANETCFLVATPTQAGVVGQAICYRALKEILTYFLGEVNPRDLQVSQITSLTADGVEVRGLSVADLVRADAAAQPRPPEAEPSPLANLTSWPLKSADGQDLRVSFAVDPVMDLKAWAMAGHRIESRIMDVQTGLELTPSQRKALLPRDFQQIDLAALERAISRLTDGEVPDKPQLILQLSFASLSNGRARSALLSRARQLQLLMRQAAICELVDVEAGVPAGRLAEVTSLIRGFFRTVWIQVEPVRPLIEAASHAKASGLTVRAADLGDDPEEIAAGLRKFVPMVKRRMLLTVTSLPTTDLMIDAMSSGFSHATLRAKPAPPPERPKPVVVVND